MSLYDFTSFDQAEYEQIVEREKREIAEAARAEGRAEGRAEERRDIVVTLVGSGKLTREEAAELLGVSLAELAQALAEPKQ